jgi:ParB-like nuclease family protein
MAKNSTKAKPSIQFRKPFKVAVDRLTFDLKNPRYSSDPLPGRSSEAQIISELIASADIAELVQSIAANGYIDIEPMVVMPSGKLFTVLEGNRRLAAIRLLSNPELARDCGFSTPTITDEVAHSLKELTVYAVDKREEARDFIGFKHINGPHRWDALAKARFAADWYKSERGQGASLQDIARRLGDRHDTVKRLVNGIFVLDQAQKARLFDISDRSPGRAFAFSHLYTALTRPGFQAFLGLPADWRREDPKPNPVPKNNLDNLQKVLVWLYGSQSDAIQPVVASQNPHIKMLDEILQKPIARRTMLARNNLQEAYKLVYSPSVQFETALLNANQNAEDALSKISGYGGHDLSLLEAASSLKRTAQIIHSTMENTPSSKPLLGGRRRASRD